MGVRSICTLIGSVYDCVGVNLVVLIFRYEVVSSDGIPDVCGGEKVVLRSPGYFLSTKKRALNGIHSF
jgi:hypothetical protein